MAEPGTTPSNLVPTEDLPDLGPPPQVLQPQGEAVPQEDFAPRMSGLQHQALGMGAEKEPPGFFQRDPNAIPQTIANVEQSYLYQRGQAAVPVAIEGWNAGVRLAAGRLSAMYDFLKNPGPELFEALSGRESAIPTSDAAVEALLHPTQDNDFTRVVQSALNTAVLAAAPAESTAWEMTHAGGLATGMKEKDARDMADKAALATSSIILSLPALHHLSENGPFDEYQKAVRDGRITPSTWRAGLNQDVTVENVTAAERPQLPPAPQETTAQRLWREKAAREAEKAAPEQRQVSGEAPPVAEAEPVPIEDLNAPEQATAVPEPKLLMAGEPAIPEEVVAPEPESMPQTVEAGPKTFTTTLEQQRRYAQQRAEMQANYERSQRLPKYEAPPLPASEARQERRIPEGAVVQSLPPLPEKGYYALEDVPANLLDAAKRFNALRSLADDTLELGKGFAGKRFKTRDTSQDAYSLETHWTGAKSPLPKYLQQGKKYSEIQLIIDKMLSGKKLTEGQSQYADLLWKWAGEQKSSVDEHDLRALGVPTIHDATPEVQATAPPEDFMPDWVTEHEPLTESDALGAHSSDVAEAQNAPPIPEAETLRPPQGKWGWQDRVLYKGREYEVSDATGPSIELMARDGKPGAKDNFIRVNENDPGLEQLPRPARRQVPAVKLDDGRIIIGSRPTHQDLVNDIRAMGMGGRVVDTGSWDTEAKMFHTDPPGVGDLLLQAFKDMMSSPREQQKGFIRAEILNPLLWRRNITRESRALALLRGLRAANKGLGARHQFHVIEQRSPEAMRLIRLRASARGSSHYAVGHDFAAMADAASGVPRKELLERIKKGQPLPYEQWWDATNQSIDQGHLKDRAIRMAAQARSLPGTDVLKNFKDNWRHFFYEWVRSPVLEFTPKEQVSLKMAASNAYKKGDAAALSKALVTVFDKVGVKIPAMSQEALAYIKTPEYARISQAVQPFLDHLRKMAEEDEPFNVLGPEALGPAGQYMTKVRTPSEAAMTPGRRVMAPMAHRRVYVAQHRMSLEPSQNSIENLALAWQQTRAATALNSLTRLLEKEGIGVVPKPGTKPPTEMEVRPGVSERAVPIAVTPDRYSKNVFGDDIIKPGKKMYFPESMAKELAKIYDVGHNISDLEGIEQLPATMLRFALWGPIEPTLHSRAILRNLAKATNTFYPQIAIRLMRTRWNDPRMLAEAHKQAIEMGLTPSRYGAYSADKLLAKEYGSQYMNPLGMSFSPTLYGPYGIDFKARVLSGVIYDELVKKGVFMDSPGMKEKFIDQLGVYNNLLRSELQRKMQNPLVQPFIGARTTSYRNMKDAFGIGEPGVPLSGMDRFTWNLMGHLKNSLMGAVITWIVGHYLMRGVMPWNDREGKFLQIPYGETPDGRTKYVGLGFLFPLGYMMSTATGLNRFVNTLMRGGSIKQAEEQWASGLASYLISFVTSPTNSSLLASTLGIHAYLTGLHDVQSGRLGPQFLPALPRDEKGPGLHLKARIVAGMSELGQIMSGMAEEAAQQASEKKIDRRTESRLERALKTLTLGLFTSTENVEATRRRLRQDQRRR